MSVILKNVCKIHLKENVWNLNSPSRALNEMKAKR